MKKKRGVIFFIFSILSFNILFGQDYTLKGGLNLSTMTIDSDDDFKLLPGYNIVILRGFGMISNLSVETGLSFYTTGFKIKTSTEHEKNSYHVLTNRIHNISIPIDLKYTYNLKKFKIHGFVGSYIASAIYGKTKIYNLMTNIFPIKYKTDNVLSVDMRLSFKENNTDYNRLDYGLKIGSGLEIYQIIIEISYNYGIPNINYSFSGVGKVRNSFISITTGYKF